MQTFILIMILQRLWPTAAKLFAEHVFGNKADAYSYSSSHLPMCTYICKNVLEKCYIWARFQFIWACTRRHLRFCTVLSRKQALKWVMNRGFCKRFEGTVAISFGDTNVSGIFSCCFTFACYLGLGGCLKLPLCYHAGSTFSDFRPSYFHRNIAHQNFFTIELNLS